MGLVDEILSVILVVFAIVISIVIMGGLYLASPFAATIGTILLIVIAAAVIIGLLIHMVRD